MNVKLDCGIEQGRHHNGNICYDFNDGSSLRRSPSTIISYNADMAFDHSGPELDESSFHKEDWSSTPYCDCKEEISSNTPKPKGSGFTMRASVDSDHAGDYITRRSRTEFIVWLNSAPIFWLL